MRNVRWTIVARRYMNLGTSKASRCLVYMYTDFKKKRFSHIWQTIFSK